VLLGAQKPPLREKLGPLGTRKSWYVYLARCADDTLYCGIARDVEARIQAHNAGRGARYTRGRGPLTVLLTRRCQDQGLALRIERAVKRLTRTEKVALMSGPEALARLVRRARRARIKARAATS
jgi:putative endonuclease